MNKICTGCHVSYPDTLEFFNLVKKGGSQLRPKCKNCEKAYREVNKEHKSEIGRAWNVKNKERKAAKQSEYYRNNKEKEDARYYKWKASNIGKFLDYIHKYVAEHKEHKKEYDKEHRKIYYQSHKEEKKAHTRNRRAKIKQSGGKHTAADVARQYERQKGKCYWCGVNVGDKYHVDHVIPVVRGGSNDPSNLVISCPTCNHSKGAKLPHEWGDKMF